MVATWPQLRGSTGASETDHTHPAGMRLALLVWPENERGQHPLAGVITSFRLGQRSVAAWSLKLAGSDPVPSRRIDNALNEQAA